MKICRIAPDCEHNTPRSCRYLWNQHCFRTGRGTVCVPSKCKSNECKNADICARAYANAREITQASYRSALDMQTETIAKLNKSIGNLRYKLKNRGEAEDNPDENLRNL